MAQSIAATVTMSTQISLTVEASSRSWKETVKDYLDPDEEWKNQCDFTIESYCEDMFEAQILGEIEKFLSLMKFKDIGMLKFGRMSVAEIYCEEVSVHGTEEAS